MKQDFEIILGNTSILRTSLSKKDRENFRTTFIKWLEEFDNVFTDLNLNIEGTNVSIHFNWGKLTKDLMTSYDNDISVSEIEEEYQLYLLAHPNEKNPFDNFFVQRGNVVEDDFISVCGSINHTDDDYNTIDYVLIIIFHIWRCCNLSFPGVIGLHNAKIVLHNKFYDMISLYSDVLGDVFNSEFIDCYHIKPLSLIKTWSWYCKVIDMSSTITKNNFDRTISSLFNYVRTDSFIQSDIVNLFLGIEAFYDLKSYAIKENLKKRGLEFLDINCNKKKFLRGISDFYDYRSRFIHGDLEIISYMDILKNFVKDVPEYDKYSSICQFGVLFILASLQNAIEKDCISLRYIETTIIEKTN